MEFGKVEPEELEQIDFTLPADKPEILAPHPTFGPKNIDTLRNFIQELPKDISLFTELRREGWYSDPKGLLKKKLVYYFKQ